MISIDKSELLDKAYKYFNQKKYSIAKQYFSELITLDSSNSEFYSRRGYCNKMLGIYVLAEEDYTKSISLSPDQFFYYDNRAELYYSMGKYKKALSDLNLSIEKAPQKRAKSYYNRGFVFQKLEMIEKSCADFKIASDLGYEKAIEYLRTNCQGNNK